MVTVIILAVIGGVALIACAVPTIVAAFTSVWVELCLTAEKFRAFKEGREAVIEQKKQERINRRASKKAAKEVKRPAEEVKVLVEAAEKDSGLSAEQAPEITPVIEEVKEEVEATPVVVESQQPDATPAFATVGQPN